jgi:WD40 repeat protein/tRNA A-37 threonylcarbamoyl transferase component Bud32
VMNDDVGPRTRSADPANHQSTTGSQATVEARIVRRTPDEPKGETPSSGEPVVALASPRANPVSLPLQQRDSARYEILAEHGRGGLGRVYRARDKELGREVALKELIEPNYRAEMRFVREALITARLEHPGVVPVHEAGLWPDGTPFYSMKLVGGRPLDALIAEASTLDQRLALLTRLIAVADAIAYAHDRKIIHRDLKPSNVIIGEFGETIVIDWGLAKDLTEPADDEQGEDPGRPGAATHLTVAGSVLGTPAYMSPEQERGERADTRSDVYSIGAMLLQLLAGELRSGTAATVELRRGRHPVPSGPRLPGSNGAGPTDLVAIARKAMAPDPDDRYATARELADDLKRFQTGQLVGARRYSSWERLGRWVARRRVVVVAASVIAAVVIGSFTVVLQQLDRARAAQLHERESREEVEARRNELILVQARSALESDPTGAIAWLKTYPDTGVGASAARDLAADAVSRGVARHVLLGHTSGLYRVHVSADGKTVSSSGTDSTLRTWDIATGRGSLAARGLGQLGLFAYDPHGRWLAHDDADGGVHLVDLRSGHDWLLARLGDKVLDLSFSDDGGTLVSAGKDGRIALWEPATRSRRDLKAPAVVDRARLHVSGKILASCGADKELLLWDVESATHRSLGSCDATKSQGFVFSAGGQRLAVGHLDGSIGIWDPVHDTLVSIRAQEELADILSLSAAGDLVATGDSRGSVTVWDTSTGAERARLRASDSVTWVELSPSGKLLVVGTMQGELRLYDLVSGIDWQLRGHTDYIAEARFTLDERFVASGSGDRTVRIWPVPIAGSRLLRGQQKALFHPVWTSGGRVVSAEGEDGTIRSWDLRSGEARLLRGHEDIANGLLSLGDDRLASASSDGTVRLWDLTSGAATVLRGHTGPVRRVSFSAITHLLASGGADGTVRLWSDRGERGRVLGKLEGQVLGLGFSPDGQLVAAGDSVGHVRVWDIRGREMRSIDIAGDAVYRLLFTPRGANVITGGQSGVVRRWSLNGGPVAATVHSHSSPIAALSVSADGRWVASGAADGSVLYTDLATGTSHSYKGHSRGVPAIAHSPVNDWIATGAVDGTIRMVRMSSGESRIIGLHASGIEGLAFSPDGALLASAGQDGNVRIWSMSGSAPDTITPGVGGAVFRAWLDRVTSASLDLRAPVPTAATRSD